jgi:hypothetical protein
MVFNRVYGLEIQSVMLVFSTQLCDLLPLDPCLWFTQPLPPLPKVKVQYIHWKLTCEQINLVRNNCVCQEYPIT